MARRECVFDMGTKGRCGAWIGRLHGTVDPAHNGKIGMCRINLPKDGLLGLWVFERGGADNILKEVGKPRGIVGMNFQYWRPVTITTSIDRWFYQVRIVLDTASLISAGKMRSDCGDLRVVDSTGQLLPYWIQPETKGTSQTIIWTGLCLPFGTKTIYLCYGNPNLQSEDRPDLVFWFFDDFSNLNRWVVESDDYELSGGVVKFNNGGARQINPFLREWVHPLSVEYRVRFDSAESVPSGVVPLIASSKSVDDSNQNADAVVMVRRLPSETTLRYWIANGSTNSFNIANGVSLGFNTSDNVWYRIRVDAEYSTVRIFVNDTQYATVAGITWPKSLRHIKIGDNTTSTRNIQDTSYDWVFVRRIHSPEPSVSIGSEFSSGFDMAKYNEDSVVRGAIWAMFNAKKVLSFDGVDDIVISSFVRNETNRYTIIFCHKPTDGGGFGSGNWPGPYNFSASELSTYYFFYDKTSTPIVVSNVARAASLASYGQTQTAANDKAAYDRVVGATKYDGSKIDTYWFDTKTTTNVSGLIFRKVLGVVFGYQNMYYNGVIGLIAIYNRALSDGEIEYVINCLKKWF